MPRRTRPKSLGSSEAVTVAMLIIKKTVANPEASGQPKEKYHQ